ncbi:TlpA family protein disulfide reductase [Desulfonema ishimotonii]|uniref:TlpA family protein disulfide reductase n=1 Tax=Desulfonema ishimotonii TaxID=45657 RepID=A0A401FWM1_9BACT|nr:TlpA disulfide reductase family protein [Desulfonema ishimotonii]GBC61368.1 TlpA family protein disulfide reductase [Desulfonema ishimotonii]
MLSQKMKTWFNKFFVAGVVSGIFLTVTVVLISGYLFFTFPAGRENIELEIPDFSAAPPAFEPFAYTGTLRTADGKSLRLSDLRDKVVFLNFWATWCPPCKAEMPSIQGLYNTFSGKEEVAFILVSNEGEQVLRQFLRENRYDFPVCIATETLPAAFNVQSIPATFIIDRNGEVVFHHVGAAKWDDDACLSFIRSLI